MSSTILKANNILKNYHGGETVYKIYGNIVCTEGVLEIRNVTESNWFLDIICSYQTKLRNEDFQVWKLLRNCKTNTVDGVKTVLERKDSFTVVCEDGNDNNLITQKIEFSDFAFDEYEVWLQNETIYLPCEH
jgi:hypothetical protein